MISATELEALLEENEGLRLEVRRLRGKRPADLCWPCEVKRRWLALVYGNWLSLSWHFWFQAFGQLWIKQNLPGTDPDAFSWTIACLLSFAPFVAVYVMWRFRLFKRSEAWKRWPLCIAYAAYQEARRKRPYRR